MKVGGDLLTNAQGFNSVLNLSDQKLFNNVIVCTTPSKGFNIGGLATGYFICPNQELRQKIYQYYQKNWLYEGDIFGTEVTKAVYSAKGAKWIDKLHLIFQENNKIIECFIWENHLPQTIMAMPSSFATVILINDDKKTLAFYKKRFFQEKLLVKFNDDFYDLKNKWFRLVLSCSNKTINEFLIRLKRIFK